MKCAVLLATAAVLVGSGAASAGRPSRSLDTLVASVTRVWNANSCCVEESVFQGTTTVPSLGSLQFSGTYDVVTQYPTDTSQTPQLSAVLAVTFVSGDGSSFTVSGTSSSVPAGSLPVNGGWAVTSANGRFAGTSGSGGFAVKGFDTSELVYSFVGDIVH
jgi:hypothetical protein